MKGRLVLLLVVLLSSRLTAQQVIVWTDSLRYVKSQTQSDGNEVTYELIKTVASNSMLNKRTSGIELLVYCGKKITNPSTYTFPYNPLGEMGFTYYENDTIGGFYEFLRNKCAQFLDPLADGRWFRVRIDAMGKAIILHEKTIARGALNGVSKAWFHSSGNLCWKSVYKDGYQLDTGYRYYDIEKGPIAEKAIYLPKCNLKKESFGFYETGELASYYSYFLQKEFQFFKDGSIWVVTPYKAHVPEGKEMVFDENGTLKRVIVNKSGLIMEEHEIGSTSAVPRD